MGFKGGSRAKEVGETSKPKMPQKEKGGGLGARGLQGGCKRVAGGVRG